jgi:hypothetical protein
LQAGNGATDARDSNFMGFNAGLAATYASDSNFFSQSAGQSATYASDSNFFGQQAGASTLFANSNFFGYYVVKQQMLLVQISWVIKLVWSKECFCQISLVRVLVICNWCISIKFHWFSAGYEAKSAFGSNFIGSKLVIKQQMLKIQISW